jgi:hypothetical protein
MPIDDSRPSRFQRPAPAPAVADEADGSAEHRCDFPGCDICDPVPGQHYPAIDPELLAELRQQIADIDAGREPPGMPWREAMRLIFAPPTPEETAEIDELMPRGARR